MSVSVVHYGWCPTLNAGQMMMNSFNCFNSQGHISIVLNLVRLAACTPTPQVPHCPHICEEAACLCIQRTSGIFVAACNITLENVPSKANPASMASSHLHKKCVHRASANQGGPYEAPIVPIDAAPPSAVYWAHHVRGYVAAIPVVCMWHIQAVCVQSPRS